MLCHIFKTGKHTDSNGNTKEWTTEDLDKICYQFKNIHSTVPICIGHPKTNSPAYGWIDEVKRIGNNLYCSFKDVQKEFKAALKQGLFKNRSISLDKDFNIRHLAFLGAQAPAIKGLEEFCEFSDLEKIQIKRYEFTEFQDIEEKEENVENETLKEQLKQKDDEICKLKRQIEEFKRVERLKEFEDFANDAIKNGNILPKHKDGIINILSVCETAENFNFSDGTEKTAVDMVMDFIKTLKNINFEELAEKSTAEEKEELQNAASIAKALEKIMKEENVDLTTAFNKLNN